MSNVVVVGAGRGIGFELVHQLLNEGHKVLVLTRNIKVFQKNKQLLVASFDLQSPDFTKEQLDKIQSFMPQIDVLVNNAGLLINKPFEEITEKDLTSSYKVNVMGVFMTIQKLLPYLVKGSHVVNISSMGGFQGSAKFPGLSAYSPAKAALCSLTEILAEEFKPREISVNCLALGAVKTEMLEQAFPGYEAPLSASQMAEYVKDFGLNGHKYYNGKILPVALSTP